VAIKAHRNTHGANAVFRLSEGSFGLGCELLGEDIFCSNCSPTAAQLERKETCSQDLSNEMTNFSLGHNDLLLEVFCL
jgi:hypothetical protein